ncbi:MAG: UDP-N-acetylglucosamine--N-acetylmuramyl-(pentapeptide) pyrophosphoryl-undecaprenol N-acetylglucosamine transferase [Candidatus Omnitrophota bacterium]|nr:UDP-N-acetylglucosamine--N-acetylmuramyl-(pentapeptide) pyrophosphoryl-undecaprenol N-acetylglucosamine transferase [Candidatus Omnitrophota bacterium]
MRVLIACGGTGGHIFPGLSLAQELQARGINEVLLLGTDHPLEVKLFGSFGLPYRLMPVAKLSANPVKFLRFLVSFLRACLRSAKLLFEYKPDIVVGFGGYASFPICKFAALMGKPLFLHEQNCEAGLANRILALLARRVAVSFKETQKAFGRKAVFTGNPIRKRLLTAKREEALKLYKLSPDKFTVLVLGGSQGSQRINTIVGDMLGILSEEEKKQISIIHIAGMKNIDDVRKKYERIGKFPSPLSSPQGGEGRVRGEKNSGIDACVYDFVEDIGAAYAAADLIVSRAGATALFEIAALGIPSIMIPYRFACGHQYHNAAALERVGGTIVMDEVGLTPTALKEKIFELRNDRARLDRLSECAKKFAVPDAASRLADLIIGQK